jgi:hypothetical protein
VSAIAAALVTAAPALAPPAAGASSSTPPVIDVAADPGTGLGEPEVRVDPRQPNDVVIGENNSGVSVSHDGGLTFKQHALPNPGDNVLAVEPDGTFVYSSLDGQVHVSADGGDDWSTVGNWVGEMAAQTQQLASAPGGMTLSREAGCDSPQPAGPDAALPTSQGPGPQLIGCDRPWLTADTMTGELYVSFTDHDDAAGGALTIPWELGDLGCRSTILVNPVFQCGRQYVSRSVDGGRKWSYFLPIDTPSYPAGGTGGFSSGPVATRGVLATAYVASRGLRCDWCVVFETSTEGGRHWRQHPTPATVTPNWITTLDASLLFQPYVAADPSRRGHYAVMVFDPAETHLLVYVTSDSGRTWEGPATLAEPDGSRRYDPWIAYGPAGTLGALWRTGYADGTYAAWAAVRPDGGSAFAPPVRLSSRPSPGPVNQLAGDDASSVTLGARYLYASWGDRRGGSLGIHFGRYDFAIDPAVQRLRAAAASARAAGGVR